MASTIRSPVAVYRVGAFGAIDDDRHRGYTACWVKGCQIGERLIDLKILSIESRAQTLPAASRRSSGSSRGRRPRRERRRSRNRALRCRRFSSPMKATPCNRHARGAQRFDREQRVVDRAERGARAKHRPAAPTREHVDLAGRCRVSGTSNPPAPSMTSGRVDAPAGPSASGSIVDAVELGGDDAARAAATAR